MVFRVVFVVSFCISVVLSFGGVEDTNGDDKGLQRALVFAMDELNKMSNNLYRYMAFKTIDATRQVHFHSIRHMKSSTFEPGLTKVVAGMKYCVVVDVGFSQKCRNGPENAGATLDNCPVEKKEMQCRFVILEQDWLHVMDLMEHQCSGEDHFTCSSNVPTMKRSTEKEEVNISEIPRTEEGTRLAFNDFVEKYKKPYQDDEKEMEHRYGVFKENLDLALVMQERDRGTARYGVTQFSDLTPEEFLAKYTMNGWDEASYDLKEAEIPDVTVPQSFDWRDHGAVSKVKDQGTCGSCWAFSTTGNIEGQWAIKKKKLLSLSEQELVDCDIVDHGCEGGLPSDAYKQIIKLGGLESESDYPYNGVDEKCRIDESKLKVYINGSVKISSNEDDMAAWLVQNGPISIGIDAMAMQFYLGGIAHPWEVFCNPKTLNHGVLIVGFGVKKGWFSHTPYWIIKNSWGASWGVQGYYLIYRGGGCCGLNAMCTSATID